jgi:hypothetical protein
LCFKHDTIYILLLESKTNLQFKDEAQRTLRAKMMVVSYSKCKGLHNGDV